MSQTESYIVLKPIAERFARVAEKISDDEIKSIIKSEMRNQLQQIRFGEMVSCVVDEWLEDEHTVPLICGILEQSIKNRLMF